MSGEQQFRVTEFVEALQSEPEFLSLYLEDPQAALARFGLSITEQQACAIKAVNAAGTTVGLEHPTIAAPINIPIMPVNE